MTYDPSQTGTTAGPETAPPVEANVTTPIPADTTGPQEAKAPEKKLKPNRHMRRRDTAIHKKIKSMERQTSNRRLGNFRALQDKVDELKASGSPQEFTDLFFKVALNRLFKKDFKDGEFKHRMDAILHNLFSPDRTFRYKEEMAAIAEANLAKKQQPTPQEVPTSAGEN